MLICPRLHSRPVPNRHRGFTLIELLVSISIFSVIGLGAHQMLRTVIDSNDRVTASARTFTQLNVAFSIIQRDFNQFVPRVIRDGYGDPLAAMIFGDEDYIIEFTRTGWSNPAGMPRSQLQRVAYSLDYDEKILRRHFWKVLDRAEDSEPISQDLLTDVTDFRVTGFSGDMQETEEDQFALEDIGDAVPLAVEVIIATEELGEVLRLMQLVDPFLGARNAVDGNQNDENSAENDSNGEGDTNNGVDANNQPDNESSNANEDQ